MEARRHPAASDIPSNCGRRSNPKPAHFDPIPRRKPHERLERFAGDPLDSGPNNAHPVGTAVHPTGQCRC
jgi:hypothetical protein